MVTYGGFIVKLLYMQDNNYFGYQQIIIIVIIAI